MKIKTLSAGDAQMEQGFSLLELLIVLTIMAVVLVAVPGRVIPSLAKSELRTSAMNMAAGLRRTRGLAIAENAVRGFFINTGSRQYGVEGLGDTHKLRDDIDVTVKAAAEDLTDNRTARITFQPDGSSAGGEIKLVRDSQAFTVRVDWLTGQVSLVR